MNSEEKERLHTTDAKGWRVYVHPSEVNGIWRDRRRILQSVLMFFFLIMPWVRINGEQFLLLDVAQRRFNIFGMVFRAHNTPLIFLVLAAAGFGLFLVTAIWGRVWCGWACPQTVFIETVFRRIERWIEGSALERRRLDAAPMSFKKIRKRALKWSLFLLASLVITHSFLAYFVGSHELIEMVFNNPSKSWTSFLFILFSTAIILFDFGWFREQFCIIMCPYGRFQSVLMDGHSMAVLYDGKRGEPRRTREVRESGGVSGDCVDCLRCVQVCPTGIDIRNGLQMECIACTACMDACDEVMRKTKKPTGLIRYDTLRGQMQKQVRWFRPRTAIYALIVVGSLLTLAGLIYLRKEIEIEVFRAREIPYQVVKSEGVGELVINHFKIEVSNSSRHKQTIRFEPDAQFVDRGGELVSARKTFDVKSGEINRLDLFVRFPKRILHEGKAGTKILVTTEKGEQFLKEVELVGPFS